MQQSTGSGTWGRTASGAVLALVLTAVVVLSGAASDAAVRTAAASPPTVPKGPEPTCPSPYAAVGYVLSADAALPALPPGISGEVHPYAEVGATVTVVQDGKTLLLTVTLDGITRELTTAPHELGGDYNRTPGPSDTGYGVVNIVYNPSGAVYVVLVQNNSGAYTRIGWRFDDPCTSAAAAGTASDPTFTG